MSDQPDHRPTPLPHELYAQAQREIKAGEPGTVRERYLTLMREHGHLVPKTQATSGWQCCPVCDGTGLVNRPPGVAGDQRTWVSTSAGPWRCQTCNGKRIIPSSGVLGEAGKE